ncbi:hypothetical protein MG293_013460 [Ovis ammon polii]|uniref:Mastermind-like 1/3 transactivation domain-containing protein n=1 Tax=Ovis ammon polii TaxID=230172 RepID=A0AAD4Y6E0_OVIAM|nr:hypothetical protein MG293_013460 [Ovis ammon polii]
MDMLARIQHYCAETMQAQPYEVISIIVTGVKDHSVTVIVLLILEVSQGPKGKGPTEQQPLMAFTSRTQASAILAKDLFVIVYLQRYTYRFPLHSESHYILSGPVLLTKPRELCMAHAQSTDPTTAPVHDALRSSSSYHAPFIVLDSSQTQLQETVKRKLEGARSPLNGDQQNGACDGSFSPTSKRIRKDIPTGMEAINNLPNNMPLPSASPLHQLDLKPSLPLQNSGTHTPGLLEDLSKNGRLPELKLPVNGCSDLEDSFTILQSKDLKQEPLDDPTCIDTSETSLSNQNKLFSDINLNDQEWQELIDELANTVPEDDIQDLFNEDFEEKKEPEFSQPATETPLSQESASVKSDPSHSPFAHVSLGSPQARPSSSGPPFSTVSTATNLPSVATTPVAPNPASSPANCAVPSPQTPNPAHTPGQAPSRPGNGYLLNPAAVPVAAAGSGPGAVPGSDLSPAEQLKQMAAQQQQRAKLMQQKQQQHSNQTSSWSPLGPPSSPYGAAFPAEKPNSPMMYPQAFNNQNPIVPPMANNLQKTTMNNYLPQNHLNMINQQPNNMGTNSLNKQHNILTYGNTKPLTHFNADLSQRMTPPMANPNKTPLTPYIQQQPPQPQPPQQPPPQLQAPRAHLSEDQKRVLLIKQKGVMSQPMAYPALPAHGQEVHEFLSNKRLDELRRFFSCTDELADDRHLFLVFLVELFLLDLLLQASVKRFPPEILFFTNGVQLMTRVIHHYGFGDCQYSKVKSSPERDCGSYPSYQSSEAKENSSCCHEDYVCGTDLDLGRVVERDIKSAKLEEELAQDTLGESGKGMGISDDIKEQHPVGLPRTTGPMQSSVPPGSGGMVSGAGPAGPGFLGSQPQTVLMKQMLIDQRAQLMEQQKQQFLREQRQQQQQQQQILTEQHDNDTQQPPQCVGNSMGSAEAR